MHCFSSFHHTNLLPHRKIKPLRKNGYKRTGTEHTFCCLFIPVRLSRECAIFLQWFYFIFYPHTSSAISFTSFNFAHCCSSVNLLPISQEANPHCGLKHKRSSGIYRCFMNSFNNFFFIFKLRCFRCNQSKYHFFVR